MEKKLTYYDFAMNDYLYIKKTVEDEYVYNSMCSIAQNCIERFLKHIIEPYAIKQNNTSIMRAHDLTPLKSFITKTIPDFSADWGQIMVANGFYFSVRHPGDNAFFVNKQDIEDCWNALNATKQAVDAYMTTQAWSNIQRKLHPSEEEVEEALSEILENEEEAPFTGPSLS